MDDSQSNDTNEPHQKLHSNRILFTLGPEPHRLIDEYARFETLYSEAGEVWAGEVLEIVFNACGQERVPGHPLVSLCTISSSVP